MFLLTHPSLSCRTHLVLSRDELLLSLPSMGTDPPATWLQCTIMFTLMRWAPDGSEATCKAGSFHGSRGKWRPKPHALPTVPASLWNTFFLLSGPNPHTHHLLLPSFPLSPSHGTLGGRTGLSRRALLNSSYHQPQHLALMEQQFPSQVLRAPRSASSEFSIPS